MKKIAFCFLIYDCINHEEIWYTFFQRVDPNKYTIYIHYKSYKPLKYFESYRITNGIQTNYADITLPLAQNILFRNAYKNQDNYKFIMVSGACIPFKSFDYIYDFLTRDSYGYLNVSPQEQLFPNCNSLLPIIEKKNIGKASQWIILNRALVKNLCFDKDNILNQYYKSIFAPEEIFYYTHIKLLGLANQIKITPNLANQATTFTNWAGMKYPFSSTSGLKNYDFIWQDELLYLMNSPCLFGRKFTPQCSDSLMNEDYLRFISS